MILVQFEYTHTRVTREKRKRISIARFKKRKEKRKRHQATHTTAGHLGRLDTADAAPPSFDHPIPFPPFPNLPDFVVFRRVVVCYSLSWPHCLFSVLFLLMSHVMSLPVVGVLMLPLGIAPSSIFDNRVFKPLGIGLRGLFPAP